MAALPDLPASVSTLKPRLTILLLTGVLLVWLFAPALGGGSSFAFRDAAHFYHPLFQYIRQEWGAGRLPLWNPYENLGTPLVAENTSSVFYPGKLLFGLPLDYTWLYNLYIVSHVALAAGTSYRLARYFGSSVLGSGVAALSYAFCGSVLFQYCNVIFLVGAAWLPLAWLYVDRLLRLRERVAAIGLGVTLALIVLGGDPHLAYNVALLAAGYAVLLWWNDRRLAPTPQPTPHLPWTASRPLYLAIGVGLAGLLAAIQVLPTLEASPHSARSRYDEPHNIYQFAQTLASESDVGFPYQGLLGSSTRGHQSRIYYFSLEPWRAIEMVWPNVTGRPSPTNRRWLSAFGMEAGVWTPSLYFGLLPMLLGIFNWSVRRTAPVQVRGLSWLVLLGAVGSFGWYGIAWALGMAVGHSEDFGIGGEVGGLYWVLATLLPGYNQFRYPAKLFVVACLGLSVLAARGWDELWTTGSRRVLVSLATIPVLTLAVAAGAVYAWPNVRESITNDAPNEWLGPFDWNGAATDFADALLHGGIVSLVLLLLLWFGRRVCYAGLIQVAVLAVIAVDLGIAQQSQIEYASSELWQFQPPVLKLLPKVRAESRVFRQPGFLPESFRTTSSPERYSEGLRWYRQTLWPKFPLPLEVPLADVAQTVAGGDYETLLEESRIHNQRRHGINLPDPSVLDLVGASSELVAGDPRRQVQHPQLVAEGMYHCERPSALPRAWIVHEIDVRPPFDSRAPRAIAKFTAEVLFPDRKPRDWRRTAVVETDEPLTLTLTEPTAYSELCRIVAAEPSRVEIDARLSAPGLVVLSDQHYPGWEATVETAGQLRSVPILRTNRVMRGVLLPAGEHRIVYEFRPRSVLFGAIISGLTTLALTGGFAVAIWRRQNRRNRSSGMPRP